MDDMRLDGDMMELIRDIKVKSRVLMNELYEPFGVTEVQAQVLLELMAHERLNLTELSHALKMGLSNLSPLCKRLEKAGYIERVRSKQDQRVVFVSLTGEARASMERAGREVGQKMAPAYARLSAEDRALILEGLKRLKVFLDCATAHTEAGKREMN